MTDALVTAISILMDDNARAHLAGIITHTSRGDVRSIAFSANARTGEWSYAVDDATFTKDALGIVTEQRGSRGKPSHESRPDHVPFELRLAFPASLPVWDRPADEWRVIDVATSEDLVTLELSHREHPDLRGSVTIDSGRRLFTSFITPTDSFRLDITDPTCDTNERFAYYEPS